MSDNVPITPGSGANIATDDVGGVQYQRTKVNFGSDGTATDVSASNPLPITVDSGTLLNRFEQLEIVLRQLLAGAAGQIHDGNGRTRVSLEAIANSLTLATITTVSTVTKLSQLGSNSIPAEQYLTNPAAWGLRDRITVS